MKPLFLAAAIILTPMMAHAGAQGIWPDEARGATFSRPGWILVIPAKRMNNGTLILWDRKDPWVQSWIVPQPTPSGIRTVAIVGDSEDQRLVPAEAIDNMRSSALATLARKYNAPAIAVAVVGEDGSDVVAAWSPGRQASWEEGETGLGKKGLLSTLDTIFSGHQGQSGDLLTATSGGSMSATIVAQRGGDDGKMEYRIRTGSQDALNRIAGSGSLSYLGDVPDSPGVIEVKVEDGRQIAVILQEAGISTSAQAQQSQPE